MEHGIVKDWNDMERIWQYIYSKDQLQTFSEEVSFRFLIYENEFMHKQTMVIKFNGDLPDLSSGQVFYLHYLHDAFYLDIAC